MVDLSSPYHAGSPVTRWASVAFGAGVGIGTAYKECSYKCGGCPVLRVPSKNPPRPTSEPLQVSFFFPRTWITK